MTTVRSAFSRALELVATVALIAIIGAAITASRAPMVPGAAPQAPDQLLDMAATALETATAPDGRGIQFEIVQRSAIHARPDGKPLVDADGGRLDVHTLGTYLERGFVSDEGFWSEIRKGTDDPEATPDFKSGVIEMSALVRDGKTWRNDGAGWYATDQPPGIGLDPRTATLLPSLLRNATDVTDAGRAPVDGKESRVVEATAKVADIPGLIAVDMESATELTKPIELAFDASGRLITLAATARNLNLADYDLLVETTLTFSYPDAPPPLPDPTPAYVEPSPSVEE